MFDDADHLQLRTYDPGTHRLSQRQDALNRGGHSVVSDLRWVPTKQGVALTMANCSRCHTRYLPDGTRVPGAPGFIGQANTRLINPGQLASRVPGGAPPFHMGPAPTVPVV